MKPMSALSGKRSAAADKAVGGEKKPMKTRDANEAGDKATPGPMDTVAVLPPDSGGGMRASDETERLRNRGA